MRSKGSAEIHHNACEHNSYRNSGRNYVSRRILTGIFLTLTLSSPIWGQKADKKSLGTNLVPAGTPYSPAILVGNTLYVSGLQGIDPHTHKLPQDFRQEVRNCLDNVGQVLKEAGMDYSDVVSAQIFLVDMAQFQQVNSIYREYFKARFSLSNDGTGGEAIFGRTRRDCSRGPEVIGSQDLDVGSFATS